MKFRLRKGDTNWRVESIFGSLFLYAKTKFFKTFIFCATIYPFGLIFSSERKIRKRKNNILEKEVEKRIREKYGLIFRYLDSPFALEALLEIFVKKFYDFFEVTKKDIVYDIGATVGEYSLKCAKKGAKVFAFEIDTRAFDAMKRHIKINHLENQIIPINCKIDKKKSIDFFAKKTKAPPTLIKMDIEGGEEKALEGAKRTLKKYTPKIILETHSPELEKNCRALLSSLGYRVVSYKELNWRTKVIFFSSK